MILKITAQYSVGIEMKEIQKIKGEFDELMKKLELPSNGLEDYTFLEQCETAKIIAELIVRESKLQVYQQIYEGMKSL